MKFRIRSLGFLGLVVVLSGVTSTLQAGKWDLLLDRLIRNTDEVVDPLVRTADLRLIEEAVGRHGDLAAEAFERGGYSLLKASREHGDEVISTVIRIPGSESLLAAKPGFALAAIRRHGDDALRLEKEVPGFIEAASVRLGDADIQKLLKAAPEDRIYMAHMVKLSDSPETAKKMISEYSRRGPEWLRRIPKKNIIIGGVLTAAILDQAVRGEDSVTDKILTRTNEAILRIFTKILLGIAMIGGMIWLLKWINQKYVLGPVRRLFIRQDKGQDKEVEQNPSVEEAR